MNLTDKEFFEQHINLDIKELRKIKELAKAGDYAACRKIFAAYVRSELKPDLFFAAGMMVEIAEFIDEYLKKAENACSHIMLSCGIEHDFGSEKVDWEFNPTYNAYAEWPWQLNRHYEFISLAKAYQETGNVKYAGACEELFESWQAQMNAPKGETAYQTVGWRTIECGIRQGLVWPYAFHVFYKEFSDDAVVDWCKSVYEHGVRIENDYTSKNWLIMEMNGLIHIAVLNPWLKAAARWKELALQLLEREIDAQIYPDGVQSEISTNYQAVVIRNYTRVMRLCKVHGIKISERIYEMIEKAIMFYVRLMMPNGKTPDTNDGIFMDVKNIVGGEADLFLDNEVFKAVAEGVEPEIEKSFVYEYPGIAALRSGWGNDDVFVCFDGGKFGSGHQHEDKLSFVMFANGKQIICEGNNYAYDSSDMRKYVLSTYSHNTVTVDGMGQNRLRDYKPENEIIERKSGLEFKLSDETDFLHAVYDEGYGEECHKDTLHDRSLYFVKNVPGVMPFVICIDRLFSENEHTYDVLWHIDSDSLALCGFSAVADGLYISTSDSGASVSVCRGQEKPHFQGWTANSGIQGDYRPVYCLSHSITAKNVRHVTVLSPFSQGDTYVCSVEAENNIDCRNLQLTLSDGRRIEFLEIM